ncbi:hypothetical protein [Terasakiella sp. SH-1]|uniref:hypothetical protein n=1 Tax=Terasakiella sp. SH-1 TaxID=2560057 RepID=UPI0010734FE1|nr:hypothetical protein [Terasakiella sp. SH-1]
MNKPKLIIWGGFWTEHRENLLLEELNSHASVNAFFLRENLEQYFTIVSITSFLDALDILHHKDAVAVLSTFQAGFTRLKQDKPNIFEEIKKNFNGKIASIVDFASLQPYAEDILFTVLKPEKNWKGCIKRFVNRSDVIHMGWSAAAKYCTPNQKKEPTRIFLDHGHYSGDDFTGVFVSALNKLSLDTSIPQFEVYLQENKGIGSWPLGTSWHDEKYDRQQKVSWPDIMSEYGKSHIFCVTHRESAGLGVIEAAMSGALIYIPHEGSPFIRSELLETGLKHRLLPLNEEYIYKQLKADIIKGVHCQENREMVERTHDWSIAAKRIAQIFT